MAAKKDREEQKLGIGVNLEEVVSALSRSSRPAIPVHPLPADAESRLLQRMVDMPLLGGPQGDNRGPKGIPGVT